MKMQQALISGHFNFIWCTVVQDTLILDFYFDMISYINICKIYDVRIALSSMAIDVDDF